MLRYMELFERGDVHMSMQAQVLACTHNMPLRLTLLRRLERAGVPLWRKSQRILARKS